MQCGSLKITIYLLVIAIDDNLMLIYNFIIVIGCIRSGIVLLHTCIYVMHVYVVFACVLFIT